MQKPFGSWPSPLTAAAVASQTLRFGGVALDADAVYWSEGRPAEGGRNVVVRRRGDGTVEDAIPPGFNARTLVHEYGGGAFAVSRGDLYFSNFDDQRIYRIQRSTAAPVPMTPTSACCYADFAIDRGRGRLIAVRQEHTISAEPANTLVSIPFDRETTGEVIAAGHDFYSTPRLSPDASRLSWLAWRHPQMPWDGTELWVADVTASGALENARVRRRRAFGIHLSARLVARRRPVLRQRSRRMVEALSFGSFGFESFGARRFGGPDRPAG